MLHGQRRILYDRDCHRQYCPPALWTAPFLALPSKGAALASMLRTDAVLRLLITPDAADGCVFVWHGAVMVLHDALPIHGHDA